MAILGLIDSTNGQGIPDADARYSGGSGDMTKSTYDTNDNGIVDNAEKVNSLTVETNVPAGAVFTDTVYDDSDVLKDADTKSTVTGSNLLLTEADVSDLGGGDMTKSTYDTNDNGIVDNAEKVNSLTVETAVPASAVFTDTVYDDAAIVNAIDSKEDALGDPSTDDEILSSKADGTRSWVTPSSGGGDSFSVNRETLSDDKTLTESDATYQIFDGGGANRIVYLPDSPESPSKDLKFVICNNSAYNSSYFINVIVGSDTGIADRLYSGKRLICIYDKDTDIWSFDAGGSVYRRTDSNSYEYTRHSVTSGYVADGHTNGVANGYNADGHTNGVANGYSANGYDHGVANGYGADGHNYGSANGYGANATKQYGSATGAFSKQERVGGHAITGDHLSVSKFHREEVTWHGFTTDDTQTEIFLHNLANTRCTILTDSVVTFDMIVTAIDTTSSTIKMFSQQIIGAIQNDAGTTNIVGNVTYIDICNTTGGTPVVNIEADDANDALIVKVTGLASTNITWGVDARLIDVRK